MGVSHLPTVFDEFLLSVDGQFHQSPFKAILWSLVSHSPVKNVLKYFLWSHA